MAGEEDNVVFNRVTDVEFWTDRQRVVKLIEQYEKYECLWNMRSHEYKNNVKRKAAKEEIGKLFSMTGWSALNALNLSFSKVSTEF